MIGKNRSAGLGERLDALAVAHENLDAELFFELDDGFRDAGLGREQRLGGVTQIEVLPHCLAHEAQLIEVHGATVSLALRSEVPGRSA